MSLFLFRFWPAFIPLLLYIAWFMLVRHKAVMNNQPLPQFRDGPWYWLIISTLGIAALCFMVLGMMQKPHKGRYIPPQIIDGKLVPGHIDEEQ